MWWQIGTRMMEWAEQREWWIPEFTDSVCDLRRDLSQGDAATKIRIIGKRVTVFAEDFGVFILRHGLPLLARLGMALIALTSSSATKGQAVLLNFVTTASHWAGGNYGETALNATEIGANLAVNLAAKTKVGASANQKKGSFAGVPLSRVNGMRQQEVKEAESDTQGFRNGEFWIHRPAKDDASEVQREDKNESPDNGQIGMSSVSEKSKIGKTVVSENERNVKSGSNFGSNFNSKTAKIATAERADQYTSSVSIWARPLQRMGLTQVCVSARACTRLCAFLVVRVCTCP